eukprot:scaffold22042_cov56-Phaeocystis_antarctica.AAC.1
MVSGAVVSGEKAQPASSTAHCSLRTAYRFLLLTAYCLLLTAYRLPLSTAYCLLLTAYCSPRHVQSAPPSSSTW